MRICLAQTKPIKGNVSANIEAHIRYIDFAWSLNGEAIFFPELSLTGFEPELARELAIQPNDNRLNIFQDISDNKKIVIGLGIPTFSYSKIRISMILFEPNKPRQTYSKQQLHADEWPYFETGNEQIIIKKDDTNIAPAICFESLQPSHAETAFKLGADVYLASVAKPEKGVEKAINYYPTIAKQYAMHVLMVNCVGFCDNFLSIGKSSIWTKEGELVGQLDDKTEGILLFNTKTKEVMERKLNFKTE
jgi:predicted amidohydrolase